MSKKYSNPGCCADVGCLIMWVPANRRRGPVQSGWAIFLEAIGSERNGLGARYVNVIACPFCGADLKPKDKSFRSQEKEYDSAE
jgi:hypothetical protein